MLHFSKHERKEHLELTITTQTFLRVVLLIIGTVIILAALHKATHAIVLIFIAFFLALALNAPVHWISEHLPGRSRGSRALATTVSFLIVIILLGAFVASLVPPLVRQTQNFISAAPHLVQDLRSENSATGKFVRDHHLEEDINKLSSQLGERLKNASGSAVSTVTRIGSSIFATLTILAMTFMMLVEGPRWLNFFRRLTPPRHRDDVDHLARDMYRVIKGYVNGQVTLAAIAAAFVVPMLFILHISYPIALMVVVFICGLIPMVGHTIGAIIVTIVALFHSVPAAIIILAYYILYQQIENYLIQPRIQANTTNLSPLLVFMSVVIGVSFSGLLGGLVAIPVMGCIRIAVLYFLERENLLTESELEKSITPNR
ncbi:MAG TPA: AI-2E family transporter [Candidatus Saccharimonadales bacterium]